jgi:pimeloyl-ACP methyl ester carboxylesterase
MSVSPSAKFFIQPQGMHRLARSAERVAMPLAWFLAKAVSSVAWWIPASLPRWLTEADVEFYAREFARTGFRGGLNWYRNIDRNWELLGPFAGARMMVPALYVAGDRDLVVRFRGMDQLIANLSKFVPQLRRTIMLPGCGHWTQQERTDEVDTAMVEFLRSLVDQGSGGRTANLRERLL